MSVDELAAALSGSMGGGVDDSDPLASSAPHPRLAQFKERGAPAARQEKRRLQFREEQRNRRLDAHAKARAIAVADDPQPKDEQMELGKPFHKRARPSTAFKDQLMLSEWMIAVPDDLEENYIAIPVPEGRRCLLVASKGVTTAYSRAGWMVKQFQSPLPGGRKGTKNDYTLLDTIYCEADKCFAVLDILCWKTQPHYDSDTEFRRFWLASQFSERPELGEAAPYAFRIVGEAAATADALGGLLAQPWPFAAPVDGVLFYPRDAAYSPGSSPLIGWLKPWMLPQVLGWPVPPALLQGRPDTAEEFIADFHENHKGWKVPTGPDGAPITSPRGKDDSKALDLSLHPAKNM